MSRPTADPDPHLPRLWWVSALAPHERTPDGSPPRVPAWATWVEHAMASWRAVATVTDAAEPAFAEIADPLRPLVDHAWHQVAHDIGAAPHIDIAGIRGGFVDHLIGRLAGLAARTLVSELNSARERNDLAGTTSRQRFLDFTRQLSNRADLSALFLRYPVLARLLGQACAQAVECHVDLLRRLETDRDAIVRELGNGDDPGLLVAITMGAGDPHQRGRSVAVLRFAHGATVVYKPRCQRVHAEFADLVGWYNTKLPQRLGLRVVASLSRSSYGWVEFVEYSPCHGLDQVDRFYGRLGALLALLYAVEATDIHYENLIACADQPVLIDVETLFHPRLPQAMIADPDPARDALTGSVYRTSLLPQFQTGDNGSIDFSGMGGDPGKVLPGSRVGWESVGTDRMRLVRVPHLMTATGNRPTLDGEEVEPTEYLAALLEGFRVGYDAIRVNRNELLGEHGLLERFAGVTTRLVGRATQVYATLIAESTHPTLLRDARDRDAVFDLLRQDAGSVQRTLLCHEIADLWTGDVPLFTVGPGSRDVWTSTGCGLPGLLGEPGLMVAQRKIAGFDELDRRHQEWLITAALGARSHVIGQAHGVTVIADPPAGTVPDPQRLLVEACGIADEIVSLAVHGHGRANWIGLEPVDVHHWAVQPLGAGLANGFTGVALFLATMGKLTGAARYTELARQAVRPLPNLVDAMTAEPEIGRAVGPGGFFGLGGIAYALSRLARLDGDTGLNDCLAATIELMAGCLDDGQTDLAFGYAGGLAALVAVHEETGLPSAAEVAGDFANRLVEQPEGIPAVPGFVLGTAGVAFALASFASGAGPHLTAARSIPLKESRSTSSAWCDGLSGSLMTRTMLARHDTGAAARAELDRELAVLAGQPPPVRDMSLCHGELGVVDVLLPLAAHGHRKAVELLSTHTARLEAVLAADGPRCGTPNGVSSPGLLTGLAGIGYGLVRLGFPDDVPSVLAFEPSRSCSA